jgi:hypothetical protein
MERAMSGMVAAASGSWTTNWAACAVRDVDQRDSTSDDK